MVRTEQLQKRIACNRASADFMISSQLMSEEYHRLLPDYGGYRQRERLRMATSALEGSVP